MIPGVPTGSETETVLQYYDYLMSRYYYGISVTRAQDILYSSPAKIFAWGMALLILLFLMTVFFYSVHRGSGELYEATNFNGSIIERNGMVSVFTWTFAIGLLISALYMGVRYILLGYLY